MRVNSLWCKRRTIANRYITTTKPRPLNNVSVLIGADGQTKWTYLKSALHPQIEGPVFNPGDFTIPFVDTKYGRLGSVICYDMGFPGFIRQAGRHAIDIMLVPAYDWAGITPLHSQMASFEAVQNGFSLVRANGAGLSAVYNQFGRTVAQMNTFVFPSRQLSAVIPTASSRTVYASIGNAIVAFCALFLISNAVVRITQRTPFPGDAGRSATAGNGHPPERLH